MPDVLCTLALPEPFTRMVSAVASIRVLGRLPSALELRDELRSRPVDVLCPQAADRIDAALLDAGLPRLRGVSLFGVGYDNVDVAAATMRGIAIGNTPGVLTDATADLTMALLLAVARRVAEGDQVMRRGSFPGVQPDFMLGTELGGAVLGIVGFGRIGQAVARRARGFGMRLGVWTVPAGPVPDDLAGSIRTFPSLADLLAEADVVTLHTPLTAETRHLIGEAELRRMKPTAILVNTSRGAVIDEPALVRALEEGWIAGAGLDVYELEPRLAPGLAECRNSVLTPHLGSATVATRAAMAELVAVNALAMLAGELPPHCVNPAVRMRAAFPSAGPSPADAPGGREGAAG
ncbi:MAG TPA: D-glycerate dehydrogenase [Candidatus Binatia bacterium]|nr:D-glycerate dehydrogenase [Candidatus Binatia bacterium]